MGGEIDRRIVLDKLTNTVQRLASRLLVLKNNGKLVCLQRRVAISHVAMEKIKEPVMLKDDNAVALGVPLRLDEEETVGNLLASGEILVGAILVRDTDDVVSLKLESVSILRRDIDLSVRERSDGSGMVRMLVGDENLGHLLSLVAQSRERLDIVVQLLAHVERRAQLLGRSGSARLETRVNEDDTLIRVKQEILQAATIDDLLVKAVLALLTTESERLIHETAVEHTDGMNSIDFHNR